MFTDVQETAIINMVLGNNAIRIREIREHILNNDTIFNNINAVSLSTIQRILQMPTSSALYVAYCILYSCTVLNVKLFVVLHAYAFLGQVAVANENLFSTAYLVK